MDVSNIGGKCDGGLFHVGDLCAIVASRDGCSEPNVVTSGIQTPLGAVHFRGCGCGWMSGNELWIFAELVE